MWKILQQNKPDDYVIATGIQYSVKEFVNLTAKKLKLKIKWKGRGINEKLTMIRGIPSLNVTKIILDLSM